MEKKTHGSNRNDLGIRKPWRSLKAWNSCHNRSSQVDYQYHEKHKSETNEGLPRRKNQDNLTPCAIVVGAEKNIAYRVKVPIGPPVRSRCPKIHRTQTLRQSTCSLNNERCKGGSTTVECSEFGEHITADHLITRTDEEEAIDGERVALVIKDVATNFKWIYPSAQRTARDCVLALKNILHLTPNVGVFYSDHAGGLTAACEELIRLFFGHGLDVWTTCPSQFPNPGHSTFGWPVFEKVSLRGTRTQSWQQPRNVCLRPSVSSARQSDVSWSGQANSHTDSWCHKTVGFGCPFQQCLSLLRCLKVSSLHVLSLCCRHWPGSLCFYIFFWVFFPSTW